MAGYLSTPRLSQFPYWKRFSVWCEHYRLLVKTDLETRLRKKLYETRMLLLVLLAIVPGPLAIFFDDQYRVVAVVMTIFSGLIATCGFLVLAFRHQRFLNRKVGMLLTQNRTKNGLPKPEVS